jgi:hypothetical protein
MFEPCDGMIKFVDGFGELVNRGNHRLAVFKREILRKRHHFVKGKLCFLFEAAVGWDGHIGSFQLRAYRRASSGVNLNLLSGVFRENSEVE